MSPAKKKNGKKGKARGRTLKPKKSKNFDLNSIYHQKPTKYNAQKDPHLQSFFVSGRLRGHLKKMSLITKEGYIIEKPEEYRRNENLLKQHMASQSVPRRRKKGKKGNNTVSGKDHEDFIENVKNEYGVGKSERDDEAKTEVEVKVVENEAKVEDEPKVEEPVEE